MDRKPTKEVEMRASRWIGALLVLGGACLTLASPAAANSYHDFLCRIPYGSSAGRPAPAEDVTYATNGTYFYAENGCEGGGSLYAQMLGEVTHPYGTSAADTFTAPAGLTIAGFILWRYEADGPYQAYGAPASNLSYSPGPPSVQGLCARSLEGCSSRGTPDEPLSPQNAVSLGSLGSTKQSLGSVTEIQWSAVCGGGTGGTCPASGTAYSSQYEVYAAEIDLLDKTPPTVSGLSGPLVAGATLTGKQAVSFNASDGQSGVYGGSLVVDGTTLVSQILNTNEGHCQSLGVTDDGQRSFEYAQPCPPSVSAGLTLNASQLAAGQHSLELIVEDAAGNQTIAYNGTIAVAGPTGGTGSTGPVSTGPVPTGPVPTGPVYTWPGNPLGGGMPITIAPSSPTAVSTAITIAPSTSASVSAGGSVNGTNASDRAKLTARWVATAKALRVSRYGAADAIAGSLTAPGGVGIGGAEIEVMQTQAFHGALARRIGDVFTGSTGRWTLTLPRNVSSSGLRFEYRSHLKDAVPSAVASLRLSVHAGIALRIAPHSASVGKRILFSGVVRGGPIPEDGKQLVLEARSGREAWIPFETIRTDAKGRYRASYRFKLSGPITYQFKVLSRYEADFPFLDGTSNVVDVREH
jgi:hypothetical protein